MGVDPAASRPDGASDRVGDGRVARIRAALPPGAGSAPRLCEVSRDLTRAAGAAVALRAPEGVLGTLCATDAVSRRIDELQFTLGEGPSLDAFVSGRPVSAARLEEAAAARWPAFTPAAAAAGAAAVFSFPLHVGAARLGTLDLYQRVPGPLGDEQHADALVVADLAARWILGVQAAAPEGHLAAELDGGADLRPLVHNAAGIVSVQLGVSITEALIRLRAHAFREDRPLRDVAADVVARKVRIS